MRTEHDEDQAFTEVGQAITRHREALQELFPMSAMTDAAATPKRIRRIATVTAVTLLLLASGLVWWGDPAYRTDRLESAPGQRTSVTLADGSILTLNTDTRLTVAWHVRSRRVVMERGEALFDVAHTRLRPFTVVTDDARVTVVGTQFDVWNRPGSTRVTVLRGQVRVDRPGATTSAYLVANQQIESRQDSLSAVATVDASARTAWKNGKLVFDRTPLSEALAELGQYTSSAIATPDSQTGKLLLSGTFNTARADAVLRLLPGIFPVDVSHDAQGRVVVRHK